MVDDDGDVFVGQRTADNEETTRGTTFLDVVLSLIDIRYELDVANGEQRGVVDQAAVDTTLIGTFDVAELEVAGLQGFLIAEVGETLGILDLGDTNGSTTNCRQLVGTHISQYTGHVAQFMRVLHACPFVTTFGQILVVVVAFIVACVKEVLEVIKTNGVN